MAQWNPYYTSSAQTNSLYEDQNLESQVYNNSLPYGAIPFQQLSINDYYVPNNVPNYGSNLPNNMRTAQEIEAEQFSRYLHTQLQPVQTSNTLQNQFNLPVAEPNTRHPASINSVISQAAIYSNLTATAAEFKPSYLSDPIQSQTFSNNNYKNLTLEKYNDKYVEKVETIDKIKKSDNGPESGSSRGVKNEETEPHSKSKSGNYMKFSNRSSYNDKYDSSQNYTNDRFNRSKDKYKQNNYNRGYSRDDSIQNNSDESTKASNGSLNHSNYQRDNNYGSKNNRYSKNNTGESSYNRSYYKPNDRANVESNQYSADKHRNSNPKNSYRNNYRDDGKYENWRNTASSSSRDKYDNNVQEKRDNAPRNNEREERYSSAPRKNEREDKYSSSRTNERDDKFSSTSRSNEREDRYSSSRTNEREDRYSSSRTNEREDKYNSAPRKNEREVKYNSSRLNEREDRYSSSRTNERDDRYNSAPRKNERDDRYGSAPRKNEREDRYSSKSKNYKEKSRKDNKHVENEVDDISQRDRLIEQVNRGTLECLVCCEFVRQVDKVWSCQKCYHIFHLRCSLKWAKTSKDENGWRCPACQHVCANLPSNYTCYCGQAHEPVFRPGDTAHSCGSVCGRIGVKPGCTHRCRLLCHPGPCPTCEDLISKSCNCGATKQIVKCSADIPLVCKSTCGKPLDCGVHFCQKICHSKECDICVETIKQECHCGKAEQTIPCTKDQVDIKNYSCNTVCNKLLLCGNHKCPNICHPGDCPICVRAIDQVKSCPCGKSELQTKRESCLDPIPCCDKICGKRYMCGQPANPHTCQNTCHDDDCPVCPLSSLVLCRCGHMSKEIPCSELMTRADDARCEKRCIKKRSCAKHKCNQLCCIEVDHICPLPCNRSLTCGQHRCEQTCHKGRCQPCWRTSFEELYCECGASVIYPPVMCGTKRPPCSKPCTRDHGCEHEALHTCHSQPDCPPCTVLTTVWCHGRHEKRSTIPCHRPYFSCGLPCNKELPCGRHKCQLPCHLGPCLKEGQNCVQQCSFPRESCGHPCGVPCHEAPCPESPCKETVKVTCECGLRSSTRACIDMIGEYQRIANSLLASKNADMQQGHSIDITSIVNTSRRQILKTLECNDECRLVERNRRLAIGLQIRNPDLSAKLTPKYSDFMRQWAKKDARFVQIIHDKLTELVQLAKQSKQKSRSYSFDSMNRDKRHFIHEYCEHFGCESAAYDQEPNRNVVATAVRDKAWLPSVSVLELLQRESGQRKVPGPILNRPLGASKNIASQSVSLKVSSSNNPRASFSSTVQRAKTPEGETIDYFDYTPAKN